MSVFKSAGSATFVVAALLVIIAGAPRLPSIARHLFNHGEPVLVIDPDSGKKGHTCTIYGTPYNQGAETFYFVQCARIAGTKRFAINVKYLQKVQMGLALTKVHSSGSLDSQTQSVRSHLNMTLTLTRSSEVSPRSRKIRIRNHLKGDRRETWTFLPPPRDSYASSLMLLDWELVTNSRSRDKTNVSKEYALSFQKPTSSLLDTILHLTGPKIIFFMFLIIFYIIYIIYYKLYNYDIIIVFLIIYNT